MTDVEFDQLCETVKRNRSARVKNPDKSQTIIYAISGRHGDEYSVYNIRGIWEDMERSLVDVTDSLESLRPLFVNWKKPKKYKVTYWCSLTQLECLICADNEQEAREKFARGYGKATEIMGIEEYTGGKKSEPMGCQMSTPPELAKRG